MNQSNEFLHKYNVYDLFIYNHDKKLCRKFQQIGILINQSITLISFF